MMLLILRAYENAFILLLNEFTYFKISLQRGSNTCNMNTIDQHRYNPKQKNLLILFFKKKYLFQVFCDIDEYKYLI